MILFLDVPTRKLRIIIIIFPIDRPDIILPTARTTVKGKSFTCFVLLYTWTFLWTFDKASPTLFLVVRTVGKSISVGQPWSAKHNVYHHVIFKKCICFY